MKRLLIILACSAGIFFINGILALAEITYDPASETLTVRAFPEDFTCTPARLLAADRCFGWNRVHYQASDDTYTLEANLVIGSNDGSETYFQLGDKDHPHQVLIVHGNVKIHAFYVRGVTAGSWYRAPKFVNRLRLGLPDGSVSATLKIASDGKDRHDLTVGEDGFGGQLHVYNSLITAAIEDKVHAIGKILLRGDSIVLKGATISWVNGYMTQGAVQGPYSEFVCENSVFQHGGTALTDSGAGTVIRNCTFSNLETAVRDRGGIDLVLVDCVFKNNQHNWMLLYSNRGITNVDCVWDVPRKGNLHRVWVNPKTGKKQYPIFRSLRHVIVKTVDRFGKPVAGATVQVDCRQNTSSAAVVGSAVTDSAGSTPRQNDRNAILLTERRAEATDEQDAPKESVYSYTIKATCAGYNTASIDAFQPQRTWETLRLVLDKTDGASPSTALP